MTRRDGIPIWLEKGAVAEPLHRINLNESGGTSGYDEAWLQALLHMQPDLFPIGQIEPGFGKLIPVCRELVVPLGAGRSGALDNFFLTAGGGLLIVEAKLWRNPEARRSVVAQAMEYAAALFRMSYEALEAAANRARRGASEPNTTLYGLAAAEGSELDEAAFVDAVGRNLQRGRAIIAVVGDGIREDILPLAELLQSHAGHRFTFALVELAIYGTPNERVRVVMPSVLAQTALIERGVVQIEDAPMAAARVTVTNPAVRAAGLPKSRSIGIGEDEFYDLLDQREAGLSAALREFLGKADSLGIKPDRQSGLNLKHAAPEGNDLNLGTITKDGYLDTGPATWWDRTEPGRRYNEKLASLIGGFVREIMAGKQSAVRTAAGKTPRLADFLPKWEDEWLVAMQSYIEEMFEASDQI